MGITTEQSIALISDVVILLIFLVVVVPPIVNGFTVLGEERKVEGSAINLTNAVNEVYDCYTSQDTSECKPVRAVVTLPQEAGDSKDSDPSWGIYWKKNPSRPPDCNAIQDAWGFLTGVLGGKVKGCGRDPDGIYVTWAENDAGARADWCGPSRPDNEGNAAGACYGVLARKGLEQRAFTALKDGERGPSAVKEFWFISPCYAVVEAYWDGTRVRLKIPSDVDEHGKPIANLKPSKSKANFCCDTNGGSGYINKWNPLSKSIDTGWADDGVFENIPGDGSGDGPVKSKPEDVCDFMK